MVLVHNVPSCCHKHSEERVQTNFSARLFEKNQLGIAILQLLGTRCHRRRKGWYLSIIRASNFQALFNFWFIYLIGRKSMSCFFFLIAERSTWKNKRRPYLKRATNNRHTSVFYKRTTRNSVNDR